MCDKVILVPRKLPWDVWFLWKASPDGGWGSSGLWHSSARAKRCSCDSRREAWQTLRRNRGSCHQDKMRIAVGGPSLAFCFCPGSGGCPGNSGVASRSIWNFKRAPAGDLPPAFLKAPFLERACPLDYLESWFGAASLARPSRLIGQFGRRQRKGLCRSLFSVGSSHRWFWSSPPPPKNFSKMTPKFFLAEVSFLANRSLQL